MKTKQTIKPSEIQVGDTVVGFAVPVAGAVVRTQPGAVAQTTVTFADGHVWKTSDHFVTMGMR